MKFTVKRASEALALVLMVAFFTPYIIKIPQIDITLILLAGVGLVVVDFFSEHK